MYQILLLSGESLLFICLNGRKGKNWKWKKTSKGKSILTVTVLMSENLMTIDTSRMHDSVSQSEYHATQCICFCCLVSQWTFNLGIQCLSSIYEKVDWSYRRLIWHIADWNGMSRKAYLVDEEKTQTKTSYLLQVMRVALELNF